MMEIKATDNSHLNSHAIKKAEDIINKIEGSLFRAIISAKTGQQNYTLQTPLGKLPINSNLPLNIGDELTLSVKNNTQGQKPELSITQIERPLQPLQSTKTDPAPMLKNMAVSIAIEKFIENFPSNKSHFVAQVTDLTPKKIIFNTPDKIQFSIQPPAFQKSPINLKTQDFVVLKKSTPNEVELRPIAKDTLLHEVQKQLLPKQTINEDQPYKTLIKFAQKLLSFLSTEKPTAQTAVTAIQPKPNKNSITNTEQEIIPVDAKSKQNKSSSNDETAIIQKLIATKNKQLINNTTGNKTNSVTTTTLQAITQLLTPQIEQLLQTINPQQNSITPNFIKQWFSQLSFFHSQPTQQPQKADLLQQFTRLNDSLESIIKQLSTLSKHTQTEIEVEAIDLLKSLLQDTKQPVEQLVHKLLFQSASNKLTQEAQQTVLINTQIPITFDKQTKEVSLKIKQHRKSASESLDDAWEVHLSFEFGLLGLISTKIFIRNNLNVVVNFWAEHVSTQQLLKDKQAVFKQQMINAGLVLEGFHTYVGSAPFDQSISTNIQQNSFIDIKV